MLPAQMDNSLAGSGGRAVRSARARPTTAKSPPYGIPASIALHALGVAAFVFALNSFSPPSAETTMVPVDLIIADATNVAAAAPTEPQEDLFVPPAPPEAVQPPMPDIAEPAPPEVKMPEIRIAPEPKPAPRSSINDLLNQLTQPDRNSTAKPSQRAAEAMGASNMATASLADALRGQIRNCWSPMTGAPDPEDQIVTFSLRLNRDGSVGGLEILSVQPNSYGAAAAEAASRAIYQCAPYRLPPERYNQWREFRPLRFDPRQMMGR